MFYKSSIVKHILSQWQEFIVFLEHGWEIKAGDWYYNHLIEIFWILNSDMELRSRDVMRPRGKTSKRRSERTTIHDVCGPTSECN